MPTFAELQAMQGGAAPVKPATGKTVMTFAELTGQGGAPAAGPRAAPEEPAFEREAKAQKSAGFFDDAGTHLAAGAADVVDFLVTGIFGMPVAATADAAIRATPGAVRNVPAAGVVNALQYAGQRIGGALVGNPDGGKEILDASLGGTREQIGKRAQASTEGVMKSLGQPARDLLRHVGILPEGYESAADKGFGYAMEKVGELGEAIETRTKGAVKKDDVLSTVTYTFGLLGAKGVEVAGKAVASAAEAAKAKRVFKELEVENARKMAEEEVAALDKPAAEPRPTYAEADARANADAAAYDLMRRGAPARDVERAVKRNPLVASSMDAIRKRRSEANAFLEQSDLPPIREDGTFREGALAAMLRRPSEMGQAELAARTAAQGGRIDPALSAGELSRSSRDPRRPTVASAPPIPPEAAVLRGPLGEPLVPAPKRPGQKGAADQQLLTAMAAGATGLGLAMLYEPSGEELGLAIGGGALLAGRGRMGELTLEAIRNTPDATPLKALLDRDTTTLGTLEMLARQSPGRFEFGVDSIKQLLKRPEVTKAEREVFDKILAAVPEGAATITAKELMEGKKIHTGDFELKLKTDQKYASYGLESLDRVTAPDDFDGAWIPEGATPEEAARLEAEAAAGMSAREMEAPKAETHIWQSPIELGTNNHFGDPNYFGHTRVFEEDGVRHVVELQSDLAQKAGKVLTAERIAELEAEGQALSRRIQELNNPVNGRQVLPELQQLRIRRQEIVVAIQSSSAAADLASISPMLRDWHKRLIREELADGARNGETRIRFADADTVAKVEGWPARRTLEAAERDLAYSTEQGYSIERLAAEVERLKAAGPRQGRFEPQHQGIYDRYSRDVTKFLKQLGGTHIVDSAGHGWWEVPVEGSKASPAGKRAQQFGGASQDLLTRLAVVGGGAAIAAALSDRENKVSNAAWAAALGGLALWGKSRVTGLADMAQTSVHKAENILGNISSEIRDMSPAVLRRLTTHAMDENKLVYDALQKIGPFVTRLSRVGGALGERINAAVLTGKPDAILRAFGAAGQPELLREWKAAREMLADLGKGLVATGRLKGLLDDYYPRIVIDHQGLLDAIGAKPKEYLTKIIDEANRKAIAASGEALSPLDISLLINKHLERAYQGDGRAGFLKQRKIDEITPELAKFYAPASESLPLYVQAAIKEIERAKFFGKDLVRDPVTGMASIDNSIANVVMAERARGKLPEAQLERLRDLLKSRFGPGERAMSRPYAAFRNMGNALLLGNIFSAAMNIADIGPIVALHGALPAVKSAMQMITGKAERITAADMGMAKHIAEEFVHGTRRPVMLKLPLKRDPIQLSTAKFVDLTFKLAGWRFLDIGMKELAVNAAIAKYRGLAKSAKGQAEIRKTYGEYFGRDVDTLINDLRSGEKSRLVQELGIRELADAQPIFKTEMPKAYLDHPDARILYMLKTFAIKQLNLVRDRGIKEIKAGNTTKGLGFLLRYTMLAGTAGMTTQMLINALLGRDQDISLTDIPMNAFKNLGFSQYVLDKVKAGRAGEALAALTIPPVQPLADILTRDPKAVSYVPVVGKLAYNRALGGADQANRRLQRERRRKELEDLGIAEQRRELKKLREEMQ